jgi:hypothetical protein
VVAEDFRRVNSGLSGAEAALYGAYIAGAFTLLGTLLGLVVERVLRSMGFLRFEASEWDAKFASGDSWEGKALSSDDEEAASADRVEYSFAVDLFNGKEIPTGLRDIRVEVIRKEGEPLTSRPEDRQSGRSESRHQARRYSRVDVINLAPRQFLRMELQGKFDREGVLTLVSKEKWRRIDFVGKRPKRPLLGILGSKTYRKTIKKP